MSPPPDIRLRPAQSTDLDALCALEESCFSSDRLSRRRMRHWISAPQGALIVAEAEQGLLGYGLALLHRGTRLARLYSLAVSASARGLGLGRRLLEALESTCRERGRLYMRLEVAHGNQAAIALYQSMGYQSFGVWTDYYEDHQDALRMQKRIRYAAEAVQTRPVPWVRQHTDFTCGPAALQMAMAGLQPGRESLRSEELAIWREATTIFMTSGHGGCHPVGLALAAKKRGFEAEVHLNSQEPLFTAGVRRAERKAVLEQVHVDYVREAEQEGVRIHYRDPSQDDLAQWLAEGALALALVSTWRLDRKKAPHWVTITAMDEACLYLHDPDPPDDDRIALDCEYLPIARADFARMSAFGRDRLRCIVLLRPPAKPKRRRR